jgi:hypothetical protein
MNCRSNIGRAGIFGAFAGKIPAYSGLLCRAHPYWLAGWRAGQWQCALQGMPVVQKHLFAE